MPSQVENGKAFEWAVGLSLSSFGLLLTENTSSVQNHKCYNLINDKQKLLFQKNASHAVKHILDKERIYSGRFQFLSDSRGQFGDVRDIVISTKDKTFGLSCKTNHSAYKHSRLSDTVDFVLKWGLNPIGCSNHYKKIVGDIFGKLRDIKKQSKGSALWSDQHNVPSSYYWPVLDAFEDEVLRVESPTMCRNFVQYLIGIHDFYKIISRKSKVEITGFNTQRVLNVSSIKLPDRIISIRNKNGSQYSKTITFNNGWEFNFRIHNASSRVEPSLKFDISATSLPPKLYQHHIDH